MYKVVGFVLLLILASSNGQMKFRRTMNQQCNIVPPFRTKCGDDNINKADCAAKGCCYGFATLPGIPRCYNMKQEVPRPAIVQPPARNTQCDVIPPFRTKCADDNISKADCAAKGCCYGFATLPGIPRCYNKGN